MKRRIILIIAICITIFYLNSIIIVTAQTIEYKKVSTVLMGSGKIISITNDIVGWGKPGDYTTMTCSANVGRNKYYNETTNSGYDIMCRGYLTFQTSGLGLEGKMITKAELILTQEKLIGQQFDLKLYSGDFDYTNLKTEWGCCPYFIDTKSLPITETYPIAWSAEKAKIVFDIPPSLINIDPKINNGLTQFKLISDKEDISMLASASFLSRRSSGNQPTLVIYYTTPQINLTVDKEYAKEKSLDYDEYIKPVEVNGKQQQVITEYDDLICSATGLTENVNFKIVKQDSSVLTEGTNNNCKADDCFYKFKGNWPRGEVKYGAELTKLKCIATANNQNYESNELIVAKHVYTFIPTEQLDEQSDIAKQSNIANAKEQFDYFLKLSELDYDTAKPIFYETEYICPVSEDFPTLEVKKCFKELYKDEDLKYDRVIGVSQKIDELFDSSFPDTVITNSNPKSLAHVLGHTYNLADESSYTDYLKFAKPLNEYPKCAIDSPYADPQGNNCWYPGDYFSQCESAGMPLPNIYIDIRDLYQLGRSIMGSFKGEKYMISIRYGFDYDDEARYPLTKRGGDTYPYMLCSADNLGEEECKQKAIHFIPPYVEGKSVVFNSENPKERRSIVSLTQENDYELHVCSKHGELQLQASLKGIQPEHQENKGNYKDFYEGKNYVNVPYDESKCEDNSCELKWTTLNGDEESKDRDKQNAFDIKEEIKFKTDIGSVDGLRILFPELRSGTFYVKDQAGNEATFPSKKESMKFVICPKPDEEGFAQLWDADSKIKVDGKIKIFGLIPSKSYYKAEGTGKFELSMKIGKNKECGQLKGEMSVDAKVNWGFCQGMYNDIIEGTPPNAIGPLEAISNKQEQEKLRELIDKTLLKKCDSMREGYNSKNGGETYDLKFSINIEPEGTELEKIILKDDSLTPLFKEPPISVTKKTIHEFLSKVVVRREPYTTFFDEKYLNCCKPEGWELSEN